MLLEPVAKGADRRSEPRRMARGQVSLWPEGFSNATAPGRLLDSSRAGFRAQHGLKGLGPGQFVHFEHGDWEGRARVVWTRILDDHVESGFLILTRARTAARSRQPAGKKAAP
ncbi:MAG TPA: hypothetical protein VE959_20430 [Bryobacteraceae bacterium]|nr:hypothetical protein SBA4_4540010 [Candidatus Sulfopaludibacter sp. SbA4]HYW45242.1 hypothetical protein [Bryobacteraceae bacterium]